MAPETVFVPVFPRGCCLLLWRLFLSFACGSLNINMYKSTQQSPPSLAPWLKLAGVPKGCVAFWDQHVHQGTPNVGVFIVTNLCPQRYSITLSTRGPQVEGDAVGKYSSW